MLDVKALAVGLLTTVQEWIEPTFKAIDDRLLGLDRAIKAIPAGLQGEKGLQGDPGAAGRDGIDGKDGAPGAPGANGEKGEPGLNGERGEKGEPGPAGEKGVDGMPGERGSDGQPGAKGDPGEPGAQGERGEKGDPGPVGAAGQDGLSGPPGEAGPKGDPGERGEKGEKGDPGEPGPPGPSGNDGPAGPAGASGQDGKSITLDDIKPMFEAEMAKALLDIERRAQDTLQRAIDKMPAPKDGRDALDLEDLRLEHDGDGCVTMRFERGELRKEFTLQLPRFKDCGVWREPQGDQGQYRKGDGVTWAGSYFIAQKDAPAGKPETTSDWRLAVKRGRDGRDGKASEAPAPRAPVKLG